MRWAKPSVDGRGARDPAVAVQSHGRARYAASTGVDKGFVGTVRSRERHGNGEPQSWTVLGRECRAPLRYHFVCRGRLDAMNARRHPRIDKSCGSAVEAKASQPSPRSSSRAGPTVAAVQPVSVRRSRRCGDSSPILLDPIGAQENWPRDRSRGRRPCLLRRLESDTTVCIGTAPKSRAIFRASQGAGISILQSVDTAPQRQSAAVSTIIARQVGTT